MSFQSVEFTPTLASDNQVIETVLSGRTESFEILMRRYNSRLYRICRSILKDNDEVLDVIQETYFRAFKYLVRFENRSLFSTWLTKIAVHEALARAKKKNLIEVGGDELFDGRGTEEMNQEDALIQSEKKILLEQAIDDLPIIYRSVLVMRDIEELSTLETAESLGLTEEVIKTRLHRARIMLKAKLYESLKGRKQEVYQLDLRYCNFIVSGVMSRISEVLSN